MNISDLYNEKVFLTVEFNETNHLFDVEMIYEPSKYGNELKQDCKIYSWDCNVFFRTPKGTQNNNIRYKTIGGLKRSIIAASKKRNLTIKKFIFNVAKLSS